MKQLKRAILLGFVWCISLPGQACGLDDCHLPLKLHLTGLTAVSQGEMQQDQWSWMNHELAVARDALGSGRRAFALEMAHGLSAALEAQGDRVAVERGEEAVLDLFESLQELVAQCGGRPLKPLQLVLRTNK